MVYIFAFIIKIYFFQPKRLSYLCLFITSFLLSCSHADNIDREVKKSINDSIYAINNKLAKERMAKIESQYNVKGCSNSYIFQIHIYLPIPKTTIMNTLST